jgi:hypothetical protein
LPILEADGSRAIPGNPQVPDDNKAIVAGCNAVADRQGNTVVGMGYGGWDGDGNFGIHEPINPRIADGYRFEGTAPVGSRTNGVDFEIFNDRVDSD